MPDRPDRSSDADAPLTVLIFPGASLMDTRALAAGLVVIRCPACGASEVFAGDATGVIMPVTFVHEDDDCPIFLRIEAALAKLWAALAAAETN